MIEAATAVVAAFPTARVRSVAEIEHDQAASARELRTLATIGLGIVLGIGAFSLSVRTASRLLQRRDSFAFLRAGGPLPGQIRRLLALESTVPLAFFSAVSALLGAAVAVSAGTDPNVPWPTIGLIYLGAVSLGVVVWAGFATSVDRLTSPTGLRFEWPDDGAFRQLPAARPLDAVSARRDVAGGGRSPSEASRLGLTATG